MCICTDQSMFARLDWVNPPSSTASLLASLKGSMEKVCCGMQNGTRCILTSAHRTRYTGIATPRAASGPPPKANRPPLFASKRAKVRYQHRLPHCVKAGCRIYTNIYEQSKPYPDPPSDAAASSPSSSPSSSPPSSSPSSSPSSPSSLDSL